MLELDEVWSFVLKKLDKRWLWTALCRRTRQIVAYVIGDRSEKTCRKLWEAIPDDDKGCQTYSDFWQAYSLVFPKKRTAALAKKVDRLTTWNVGIIPCDNGMLAMFARLYLFQKKISTTILSLVFFIVRYNLSKLSLIP